MQTKQEQTASHPPFKFTANPAAAASWQGTCTSDKEMMAITGWSTLCCRQRKLKMTTGCSVLWTNRSLDSLMHFRENSYEPRLLHLLYIERLKPLTWDTCSFGLAVAFCQDVCWLSVFPPNKNHIKTSSALLLLKITYLFGCTGS